jgi:hypothetical protein
MRFMGRRSFDSTVAFSGSAHSACCRLFPIARGRRMEHISTVVLLFHCLVIL